MAFQESAVAHRSALRASDGANTRWLLVDNGSLVPASTRQLRQIAVSLQGRLGGQVSPVSLAHSDKADRAQLDGVPAELFEAAVDRVVADGAEDVVTIPLFVGPSYAITRHVPTLLAHRQAAHPTVRFRLAKPLFQSGDARLGRLMSDLVGEQLADLSTPEAEPPRVVIVDHGSPSSAVTKVRNLVSEQVRRALGRSVQEVSPASMERRAGAEFDFNEPQLEKLLARPAWRTAPLVVGLLFLAPGRHAGPEGDVAQMVARSRGQAAAPVRFTRLVGEHPRLIDILADRARAARRSAALMAVR